MQVVKPSLPVTSYQQNFLVLRRVRRVGSTGRPNATLGTPGARLILQKQMGGVRSDGERWGAAWSDLTIMYDIQIAIIVVLKLVETINVH